MIVDESPWHVIADRAADSRLNRRGEYSEVHVRVIQIRQQENWHPVRHDPE